MFKNPWLSDFVVAGYRLPAAQLHKLRDFRTVDPHDPIVASWHSVRPKAREVLKSLPWAIMSVVNVCYRGAGSQHPMVVVGAPEEFRSCWEALAERIYSLCKASDLDHVPVTFHSVEAPLAATDFYRATQAQSDPYIEWGASVPMGSSFGPVATGDGTSASMGGSIMLQGKNEPPTTLLLSAFHPFQHVVDPEALLHGWHHEQQQSVVVKIPSPQDTCRLCEDYNDWIEEAFEGLARFDRTPNWHDTSRRYFNNGYCGLQTAYKELEQLQATMGGTRGQGSLQYGSGLGNGLDWSLSSFNDRRIDNVLPKGNRHLDEPALCALGDQNSDTATVVNRSRAESGSLVIKRGRTTGLTGGRVNAIPSDVMFWDTSTSMKTAITFEARAVIGTRDEQYLPRDIVGAGDSGAWFLNADGEWVGSVIARHTPTGVDRYMRIGLFIDAEKIVEDIEAFTGKKVVYPSLKTVKT